MDRRDDGIGWKTEKEQKGKRKGKEVAHEMIVEGHNKKENGICGPRKGKGENIRGAE